ncbi:MAG: cytochrome c family protein [Proteobacteria bacterium]|nr:cytochrome c family protein [Pseudomonadota bacterium]
MKPKNILCTLILTGLLPALGVLFFPAASSAQEEAASPTMRYKQYEVSTGYYEAYEVKPRHQSPFVEIPGLARGIFPYSPAGAGVRNRSRLSDSHQGIQFYDHRRCEDCHLEQTKGNHMVRANLTCRQCHGGEPIASIRHYYSPMNPIRRHAYICSKCHEGASASYAGYVVHEPNPAMAGTLKTFPALFYAFWIMIAIALGTFVVFLPHTILWGLRELLSKKRRDRK